MSQATAEQTAGTPAAEAPAHFSASHRELTDALNLAALAVPPRPPVATMGGIVAHTQGRALTLSAYDYEVAVSVTLPADTGTTGRSVLNYDELTKTLAAAVAGETKAAAGTVVTVDGDQLSTSQVSVPVTVYPLDEYPILPPAAPPGGHGQRPGVLRPAGPRAARRREGRHPAGAHHGEPHTVRRIAAHGHVRPLPAHRGRRARPALGDRRRSRRVARGRPVACPRAGPGRPGTWASTPARSGSASETRNRPRWSP